jgi:hypothetical protein
VLVVSIVYTIEAVCLRKIININGLNILSGNALCMVFSSARVTTRKYHLKTGTVLRIRKPSRPDAEQQRLDDKLGIDWKAAFPAIKSTTTP